MVGWIVVWTKTTGFVVAAILVVGGLVLVAFDDPPDGPFETEAEEEADAGAGDVDLTWWLGIGAIVLGVVLGVWAWVASPPHEY